MRVGLAASPQILHGVPVLHTWAVLALHVLVPPPRQRRMGSWWHVRRLHCMRPVLVVLLLVLGVPRMYMVMHMVV